MPLFNQKLKKVTFKAFTTNARSGRPIGVFQAMYNPESFSQTYEIAYGKKQGFDSSGRPANYARSKPRHLQLRLIIDGSGVDSFSPGNAQSVTQRVKSFIDLTYTMNGQIHEPNYLLVEWGGKEDGGLIFSCRLQSVTVNYTSFNRDGSPLRAELDVTLVSDREVQKRVRLEDKSSPDLTHMRTVKQGDTLPLLTKEIYGAATHYLHVAAYNHLDHFRELTPGQELHFPPLAVLLKEIS